jgi:uncharacterized protein with PIN domain
MLNDLSPHVVQIRSNQSRTVPHTTNCANYRIILEILREFVREQVIYVGGPWSGLMQCANCGKVLWAGKSAAAII